MVDGRRVRARYLVAADGVHSGIRRALGIPLAGDDDLGTMRGIAFRADLTPWTGPTPRGLYALSASGSVLLATHPDGRWVVNGPDLDPDAVAVVRRVLGVPDLDVDVVAQGRWTAVARSAQRYAEGPVFLVGDAAHQVPPAGATGVSTATADVHNLAWKLAAVLDGRAGEGLLGTYAAEREPVGRRAVAEARAAWPAFQYPTALPFAGRTLRQVDLGYRYASAAVVDDGSPDRDGPTDDVPTADPGRRAPHLWLGGGRPVLDLFGRDLTLLTVSDGAAWRAAAPDRVAVHTVDEPGWPRLYGVGARGAVLVRPEGHVAWRAVVVPGAGTRRCADPTPVSPAASCARWWDGCWPAPPPPPPSPPDLGARHPPAAASTSGARHPPAAASTSGARHPPAAASTSGAHHPPAAASTSGARHPPAAASTSGRRPVLPPPAVPPSLSFVAPTARRRRAPSCPSSPVAPSSPGRRTPPCACVALHPRHPSGPASQGWRALRRVLGLCEASGGSARRVCAAAAASASRPAAW